MNMSSSEARNNEGYQKSYCEHQEVGLCVSQEVDGGKPMDLGEVMSKKSGRNWTPGSGERKIPRGG